MNLLDALTSPGVLPAREVRALTRWAETFYPFQREWLFEPAKFAICCKSRKIGLSHTSGAAAVLWAAFLGETASILSVGQKEADLVLEMAKKHATLLQEFGSKKAKVYKENATELAFSSPYTQFSGGKVISLPSSGGRGAEGSIILDEFAYHDDAENVWDTVAPLSLVGGKLRMLSTPNGAANLYHRFWTDPKMRKGWVRHRVDLQEARSQGLEPEGGIESCWQMAHGDPRVFGQFFECSFLDADLQYFNTADVDAAVTDDPCPSFEGWTFFGIDVGLVNDLTTLTVLRKDPRTGLLWEVETRTTGRRDWEEQEGMILSAVADWEPKRICVDRTGIGRVPAERLRRRFGANRVEEFDFTNQSKDDLVTGLYSAFSDRQLRLLRSEEMRQDLLAIRRTVTSAGNVRYDAPRTDRGHADRAWSLALAVRASRNLAAIRKVSGPGDYRN